MPDDRHRVCERHAAVRREDTVTTYTCRSCGTALGRTVLDLGRFPLANEYPASDVEAPTEPLFPLHVRVASSAGSFSSTRRVPPEPLFSEYAYLSTPG